MGTVGETNKELRKKIIEMEKEIARVQTKAKDGIASAQEANEKLEEKLTKIKNQNKKCQAYVLEQNQKFKAYALDKKYVIEKSNELNEVKTKENETALEEIKELKLNLKQKHIQIEKQNEEKRALEYQNGDLAYKLSAARELEQKFLSLEKETNPLKAEVENYHAALMRWKGISASIVKFCDFCAKFCIFVGFLLHVLQYSKAKPNGHYKSF